MSRLESIKRVARRSFSSIPFFIILGLLLGYLISIPVAPQPSIAVIGISGTILGQSYADDILDMLKYAKDANQIKGVVLLIDSPGGGACATEQIYLDMLRLRQHKPVVTSIGTIAASGGYYIAIASNFIYAEPTSQIGSVGVWVSLPEPETLEEDVAVSGPFKATGGPRRKIMGWLEMVRREFIEAVRVQRGDRLQLSSEELSRGEIYLGIEGLRCGLIDEIGTRTDAIEKAASLAGLRHYNVVELYTPTQFLWFFGSSELEALKNHKSCSKCVTM